MRVEYIEVMKMKSECMCIFRLDTVMKLRRKKKTKLNRKKKIYKTLTGISPAYERFRRVASWGVCPRWRDVDIVDEMRTRVQDESCCISRIILDRSATKLGRNSYKSADTVSWFNSCKSLTISG